MLNIPKNPNNVTWIVLKYLRRVEFYPIAIMSVSLPEARSKLEVRFSGIVHDIAETTRDMQMWWSNQTYSIRDNIHFGSV